MKQFLERAAEWRSNVTKRELKNKIKKRNDDNGRQIIEEKPTKRIAGFLLLRPFRRDVYEGTTN